MKDFRRFMQEAKRRKLRIIIELVVNHTSDQHPWFQRARASRPGSDARNWYVWSDTDQRYAGTRVIFNDTEKSNWAWDPVAQAYYWHRFFSHQPDLNFDNPNVIAAIAQVVRRWLDLGVDGFRLDAIPYLCEREGTSNENLPETHAVIKRIRAELDAHARGKLLLAEANQWPEDVAAYFGDGDECHMAYHFPLMPRIYMAIAQEDRFPITDIVRQTPDIPPNCQWALFLRNHDELTLEMVTDVERDYLWSTYASDPRARINLGIRRRLAPLMDNDRRKIELVNALLAVVSRHPDHLLRRRDRDGRQHLSGRSQRRAHPDAMDAGPQWRLLALRPGAAVPAHHHGPGLRLRSRERGGAVAQHRFAAELDQAADLGAQVQPGVRPRRAVLHPHPQPLGDGLCPATRERGHPVRRQSVALRAGDGDRSHALARPRPARDAGPPEFPADRRPALCGHARPLWILLVLSLRAVRRDRIPQHRPGVRDPGGHRGLALAFARPRPCDPRARRAAGLPGEPTLVSCQGQHDSHRQARRHHPAHRRRIGAGAGPDRDQERARQRPIPDAARDQLDALRSRPPRSERARGGAPRAARRHAPGCDRRCGVHLHAARQGARRRYDRDRGGTAGIRPGGRIRPFRAAGDRGGAGGRYRAVEHHGAGGRPIRGQAVPPDRARHQSGDRGRTLPHRDRRLRQHAAAAWNRGAGARARPAAPWRSFTASSRTRATPGR